MKRNNMSGEDVWRDMGLYLIERGYLNPEQLENFIEAKREMHEDELLELEKNDKIQRYK